MNARQQQQQPNQLSGFQLFGLLALGIGVVGLLLWWVRGPEIVYACLRINFILLKPFTFFSSAVALQELLRGLAHRPADLSFGDILSLSNQVARFYLPLALILVSFVIYRTWDDPFRQLTKKLSPQELLEALNQVFPYTTPILHQNLNFDNPPEWASALAPYEFARKHKLLVKGRLDTAKAAKVFQAQVGDRYSFKKLRSYEKALFAVFAARLAGDPESQKLIDELARSCARTKNHQPAFDLADDLALKHRKQADPFRLVHQYTRTLLCSMFEGAKLRGKLTPSMFLWLKPIDRTLWYALNRVGAQTPFTEGAGVWNCWKAEQVAFTDESTIDWLDFLDTDPLTEKLLWPDMEPEYVMDQLWTDNAVEGLEHDLQRVGLIN